MRRHRCVARIAAETVGGLGLSVELDGLGAPRRTGTEVSGDLGAE